MPRPGQPALVPPQHYTDLTNALGSLNKANQLVQVLEACGQDCQQYRELIQHYGNQLERVLKAMYPNGKPKGS